MGQKENSHSFLWLWGPGTLFWNFSFNETENLLMAGESRKRKFIWKFFAVVLASEKMSGNYGAWNIEIGRVENRWFSDWAGFSLDFRRKSVEGAIDNIFCNEKLAFPPFLRILEILGSPCDLQRHSNPQD